MTAPTPPTPPSGGGAGGTGGPSGSSGVPQDNQPEQVSGLYHQAVTGKQVPADTKISVTRLRAMVNRYGSITAAAANMGVARTTFSGWINKDKAKRSRPSAANRTKIVDAQRRIRQDDARKAVEGRRGARLRKTGATLSVDGVGGPVTTSPEDSRRDRDISIFLTGSEADQLAQLMAAEDPAAMDMINALYANKYMDGLHGANWQWEWTRFDGIHFDGF